MKQLKEVYDKEIVYAVDGVCIVKTTETNILHNKGEALIIDGVDYVITGVVFDMDTMTQFYDLQKVN